MPTRLPFPTPSRSSAPASAALRRSASPKVSCSRGDHECVVRTALASREQLRHRGRHLQEFLGEFRHCVGRHESSAPWVRFVLARSRRGSPEYRKAAVPLAMTASSAPSSHSVKRVSTFPAGPLQASARAKKGPFRPGATKCTSQSSTCATPPISSPCSNSPRSAPSASGAETASTASLAAASHDDVDRS